MVRPGLVPRVTGQEGDEARVDLARRGNRRRSVGGGGAPARFRRAPGVGPGARSTAIATRWGSASVSRNRSRPAVSRLWNQSVAFAVFRMRWTTHHHSARFASMRAASTAESPVRFGLRQRRSVKRWRSRTAANARRGRRPEEGHEQLGVVQRPERPVVFGQGLSFAHPAARAVGRRAAARGPDTSRQRSPPSRSRRTSRRRGRSPHPLATRPRWQIVVGPQIGGVVADDAPGRGDDHHDHPMTRRTRRGE